MLYGFSSINSLDSKTKTGVPCERSRIFFSPLYFKTDSRFCASIVLPLSTCIWEENIFPFPLCFCISVFDQCHNNYEWTCLNNVCRAYGFIEELLLSHVSV